MMLVVILYYFLPDSSDSLSLNLELVISARLPGYRALEICLTLSIKSGVADIHSNL